jgi:hypothetical protein
VIFTYVLSICLRFTSSIISSPPPLFFFLEQFQHASFFHFNIWIQNMPTIFTLIPSFPLYLCPPPSHWYPPQEKTYFNSVLHFFKVCIDNPRRSCLEFQTCIYSVLVVLITLLNSRRIRKFGYIYNTLNH